MKRNCENKKSGFTLLEVVMATVILSIAFSSMTMAIVNSRKNLPIARQQRIAMEIAESKLENWTVHPTDIVLGTAPNVQTFGTYSFDVTTEASEESQSTAGGLDYEYYLVSVTVDNPIIRPVTLETAIKIPEAP